MRDSFRSSDATVLFASIITAQGNSLAELTAAQAWDAFATFARIPCTVPARPDADGLLYEYGVYDFTGTPRFTLSLVRQFAASAGTEQDDYIQFHCDLLFEPIAELETLGSYNSWRFVGGVEPLDEWLYQVRARPEWQRLSAHTPVARNVWQSAV